MSDTQPTSTRRVTQRPSVPSLEQDSYAHFAICRFEDGRPDLLGAGGMGTTYRAFDLQLQRPVALKTIHPQHMHDAEARSRFLREARAAARIQHPNVAGVIYQGETNRTCFYVMELVTGESLAEYVVRNGTLEPAAALGLAHQVALALDAAHREQVLHRDLKPGNIMLTHYHDPRHLHVKVIDFGLAKLLLEGQASYVTLPGFLGTPGFASPEQCQEMPVDARSDLYSLGATLWFMLSGGAPFLGSALSVIKAHVECEPNYDSLVDCPAPVVAVLRRLLAKNPDDRPASALEAADEIERAQLEMGGSGPIGLPPVMHSKPSGRGSMPPSAVRVQAGNRMKWIGGGLVGLVLIAAGIGWGLKQPGNPPTVPVAPLPLTTTSQTMPSTADETPARPVPKFMGTPVPETAAGPALFTNSLGMKFRPLGVLPGQLSLWETRVADYRVYAGESKAAPGSETASWDHPGFIQGPDHPVVWVSMAGAQHFCQWLTSRERKAGTILPTQYYRLPTRLELDVAVGRTPPDFMAQIQIQTRPGFVPSPLPEGPFPWGMAWPPPAGAGNFADQSALAAGALEKVIPGYEDGYAYTAPVGTFPGADYSDLMGNVREWVIMRPGDAAGGCQGAGWATQEQDDFRHHQMKNLESHYTAADLGFRCILVDESDPKLPGPNPGGRPGPGR